MGISILVISSILIIHVAVKTSFREEFKIKKHYKDEEKRRTKDTGIKVRL